ncbi:unnamed protein product [Closterium sp. NIES-54]
MAAAKRVLRYLCSTSGLGLVLGGRSPVVLTGHADASWVEDLATQRSSQGYTFSLGCGSVSWLSTRSSSVLSSSFLYVDNKAMLALCREHRLEHRTKHIALRYFLARELQQRGQLRLAYVASEANTGDIFTKALAPFDHQCFCTLLVGGVLSMSVGAIEELAIGVVSVVVVSDVVSAAVDVVSSCWIVANARVLSASCMLWLLPIILTVEAMEEEGEGSGGKGGKGGKGRGGPLPEFKEKVLDVLKAEGYEDKRSSKLSEDDFVHLLAIFNRAGIHFG